MRPTVSTGDLALTAQMATPETFAPYGQLLSVGQRTSLGRRGRVSVAVEACRAGPRRVTHLTRYPEARRVVLPLTETAQWIVLQGSGERPTGQPVAFLIPAGVGVGLDAGIWHAGPVPLLDASLCELLEAIGPTDRLDRRGLPDLADVLAVRVLLPDESGAPITGLDLGARNAVLLDASLYGRIRLACVALEDLVIPERCAALDREMRRAIEGVRSMWGHITDLSEIPGIAEARTLFRTVGIDPERFPPRSESLLSEILQHHALPPRGPLQGALTLCALRMRVPMAVYDLAGLGDQIHVRTGAPGESYAGRGRGRVVVEGRPVLCDVQGPFGSPLGDARHTEPETGTRRVLIVLYLPPSVDPAGVEALLEGVEKTLQAHCGGRPAGRLVVG